MQSPIRTLLDRVQGKAPAGARRAGGWSAFRRQFMQMRPICEVCGRKRGLEAHHVIPFHVAPDLELEIHNLVALCRRCHLLIGHLGGWSRVNLDVLADVTALRFKIDQARE